MRVAPTAEAQIRHAHDSPGGGDGRYTTDYQIGDRMHTNASFYAYIIPCSTPDPANDNSSTEQPAPTGTE
jgi:hypothetical protein